MRLRISSIRAAAADRPEGYVDDVLAAGVTDGEWLEIDAAALESLRQKYRAPESYPSVARMASNAAQAAAQEALAIASLKNPVDAEEVTRRLAICHDCRPWFDPVPKRCKQCGCFIEIKARMRSQHCPINKW